MSQQGLSIANTGEEDEMVLDSVYEELFDNTVKFASGNPHLKEFDLQGAKAFNLYQVATIVNTSVRTVTSFTNWPDPDPTVINDNLGSAISTTTVGATFVIDFGSIVTRNISSKASTTISCNSSGPQGSFSRVSIEYSTDNISYSGGGTISNCNGIQSNTCNNTATRTDNAVNMRYARVTDNANPTSACSGHTESCFQVWEAGTGLGTAQMSFEIFNDLTLTWDTYGLEITPSQQSSATGSDTIDKTGTTDNEIRNFPKGAGKIRAVYTITDGCDASAGVLKIFG